MDAGEFAIDSPARAEAVCGGGFHWGLEVAGPEWILSSVVFGCCVGCFFGFGGGLDKFLVFGARFHEFGFDGDGAGAVVGGTDWDRHRQVAWPFLGISGDFEAGWAGWGFDIDAGEGEPGVVVRSFEELDFVAKPFAIDFGEWVRGVDADELGRAGFDDGWGEGDGLGLENRRKRE